MTVTKDDCVFADADGVIVIATADAPRIVAAARDIATREQAQATRLLGGERLRDQLQLDAYVARRQRRSGLHLSRASEVTRRRNRNLKLAAAYV